MGTLLDLPWIQDSTQVYPQDSTAAGQAGGASVDYYRQSNKVWLGGNSMDGIKAGPRDDQLTTQLRVSYMLHYNAE